MANNKWLKCGLVALACYTFGYVGGGFVYSEINKTKYWKKIGRGYYNRDKYNDKQFTQEFMDESNLLEQSINLPVARKQFTLDVLVVEDSKLFFDDVKKPSDNDAWVDYVREAVESLREYKRAGIGFTLNRVTALTGSEINDQWIYDTIRLNNDYNLDHIYLALVPPWKYMKLVEGSMGWAISEENIAFAWISNNRHMNKMVVLHEIGHLLGLKHKPAKTFAKILKKALIDPYNLYFKDSFMSEGGYGLNPCIGLSLMDDELKSLKKIF